MRLAGAQVTITFGLRRDGLVNRQAAMNDSRPRRRKSTFLPLKVIRRPAAQLPDDCSLSR
jgi:hypothetical protein